MGRAQRRYYTPREVAEHDSAEDCWVSFFGQVHHLTPLLEANKGILAQPIIDHAGQDITHWFDSVTRDVKSYVDPATELRAPYTPMGRFIHVPPLEPTADWVVGFEKPWWKDEQYVVGKLTAMTRPLSVKNMLTRQQHRLEVCAEESMDEILQRYLDCNNHAGSYTWKRTDSKQIGRVLDMGKTLDENGIPDERPTFDALSIDDEYYVPTVHLYFADDLTVL
ncbi:hypothetical protein KFE25_001269 [Diacronema lutheri]|uniref:Cytochrome b5 domain-containing protein 1 n=1 Tax=Diacronema lutheri TaxID=2081491 RepID=A0A8J5X5Q4_DIALT|nr:hypothetical protein KFE25_001269 [Diacronema lutheri]